MHVKDAIAQRRSIRRYSDEPVPREIIVELLEAARRAPSGNNSQPWRFIVVEDAALRTRLAKVCHDQAWMADAPVHIAVCADLGARTAAAI
jgi:nitroreductase